MDVGSEFWECFFFDLPDSFRGDSKLFCDPVVQTFFYVRGWEGFVLEGKVKGGKFVMEDALFPWGELRLYELCEFADDFVLAVVWGCGVWDDVGEGGVSVLIYDFIEASVIECASADGLADDIFGAFAMS